MKNIKRIKIPSYFLLRSKRNFDVYVLKHIKRDQEKARESKEWTHMTGFKDCYNELRPLIDCAESVAKDPSLKEGNLSKLLSFDKSVLAIRLVEISTLLNYELKKLREHPEKDSTITVLDSTIEEVNAQHTQNIHIKMLHERLGYNGRLIT